MSIKQHSITILTAKSYFLTAPTQKYFWLQYSFSTTFTRIRTIRTSMTFETRYGRVLLTFIFSVFSFIFSLVAVRSWFILRISLFIIWKRTNQNLNWYVCQNTKVLLQINTCKITCTYPLLTFQWKWLIFELNKKKI